MVRQYSDINNVHTPNTLIHSLVMIQTFQTAEYYINAFTFNEIRTAPDC